MADEYKFRKCIYCKLEKPCKNGVCVDCNNKVDMPDFLKNLFNTDRSN